MNRFFLAIAVASYFALATAAQAEPILDFNMDASHPATASISYDGLGGPLVGVDISVDTVLGIGTPSNPGIVLPITNGVLTFTTGNLTSFDAISWHFGPGGTITLTGDVGFGPSVLLSGTFTDSIVVAISNFKVAIAGITDVKDENLAGFYGLPGNAPWVGGFNLSFQAVGGPPGGFTSTQVLSGDVINSVPEPGSIAIQLIGALGLSIAGLGAAIRRRVAHAV